MMNDTTNINLNDLPVTLEEDEAMLAMEQARLPHKEGWDNAAPQTPALPIQDLARYCPRTGFRETINFDGPLRNKPKGWRVLK